VKIHSLSLNKPLLTASAAVAIAWASQAPAHECTGTLDPSGTKANDTLVIAVGCVSNTPYPPSYIYVSVQDFTASGNNSLISAQVFDYYGGRKMLNTTDTTPGTGSGSPAVQLYGQLVAGVQAYFLSVNKTAAGRKEFQLTYHCKDTQNNHILTYRTYFQSQPANNFNCQSD